MIKVSQLIGQPVVSLGDAERRGAVTGVRFEGNRIAYLDVEGSSIPIEAVQTLEGDVITFQAASDGGVADAVERADEPVDVLDEPADGDVDVATAPAWSGDPTGKVLLTTRGTGLGMVDEIHVESDGTVSEIMDDLGRSYPGDGLLAVGSYAVIVSDDSDPAVRQ